MKKLIAAANTLLLTLLSAPGLAWAVEITAQEGIILDEFQEDLDPHHEGGGLPQFDPEHFASQIFWLAIVFAVMYGVFSKKILPGLSGIIENRRLRIQDDLDQADALTEQAEAAQQRYEQDLAAAREEAASLLTSINLKSKETLEETQHTFQERVKEEIDALYSRLSVEKEKAMADMQSSIVEIAQQVAEKVAGISTNASEAESVIRNLQQDQKAKAA